MNTSQYSLSNFRKLPLSKAEDLKSIQLSDADVLVLPEDIRVRRTNADKGIALGGNKNYTTSIVIKAMDTLYRIETKIVGIRDEVVFTSDGMQIPLKSIYHVDFY